MAKTDDQAGPRMRTIVQNRKARHLYHIDETWEAGIVLVGTEVKSLRAGRGSLVDSYAEIRDDEVWLNNFHIAPYEKGNRFNVEEKRSRKLLMKRSEIRRLTGKATQPGYTLIPLKVYFKGQRVKVQIALCRGKKDYDKRRDIKDRDMKRDMDRAMSGRY